MTLKPLLAALLIAVPASTQQQAQVVATPPEVPRIVVFDDSVRAYLASRWSDDPYTNEQAYCMAYIRSSRWGVAVWRVWAVAPAESEGASHYAIHRVRCPSNGNVAMLHTHPSSTCDESGHCAPHGLDGHQCFPSDVDEFALRMSGEPFGAIQCDRWALLGFYPSSSR